MANATPQRIVPISEEPLAIAAGARTPAWRVLLPLGLIIGALIALLAVPNLFTQRIAALRIELSEQVLPQMRHLSEMERLMASEVATIRGFALSGDSLFLRRFTAVQREAETVTASMRQVADQLPELVEPTARFLDLHAEWMTITAAFAEGTLDRETFMAQLPTQQARYETVMNAAAHLDEVLTQTVFQKRGLIRQTERTRTLIEIGLAVLALLAAAAALWLGLHLRALNRRLFQRAREEAGLRRVTTLLAEATDLQAALDRIATATAEIGHADGVHIQQVNVERQEIEVIAARGQGVPATGLRVPYPGSMAEQVIRDGSAAQTTVAQMVAEQRPLAPALASACADCRLLVVPLLSEGEAVGALMLNRLAPKKAFTEAEAEHVHLLANMAALVLRRLLHFEDVRRRENELNLVSQKLKALNETLETRVQQQTDRVRQLASDLTLAEQRERREIAQFLHDDIQQQLYGLQLRLRLAQQAARQGKPEETERELAQAYELAQEAVTSSRHLTVDLSPPVLKGEGLAQALRWLGAHMHERFGLRVELNTSPHLTVPGDEMRVLLFQIVRELLFNVVRHAHTNEASVTIEERNDYLVIEVKDKGRGFRPGSQRQHATVLESGFGLHHARERLALFEGRLDILSHPGDGTTVTVAIPIERLLQA